jgi:chromosome segregation ATPase
LDVWALVQTIGWLVVMIVIVPLLRRVLSNQFETLSADMREHVTAAMQAPANQATATATKMEAQVSEFSRVVSLFESTSRYFIDANTTLRANNQALSVKVDNQEASIATLTMRLDAHNKTIDELVGELQDRAEVSKQNATQINDLTSKVEALDEALKGTKTVLQATQDELEVTRRELDKTRVELASAQRRITDLESQRDNERASAAKEKATLETELSSERAKVTELEAKVKTLETQVKDLQAQLDAQKSPPTTLPEQNAITQKLDTTLPSAEADPTTPGPGLFTIPPTESKP